MKIIIFASHGGSNAENIIHYFEGSDVQITGIFCNNKEAGVLDRAKRLKIPAIVFSKDEWLLGNRIDNIIAVHNPDLIILAGFLLKFPERLLLKYPKVVNIHPALLPKFGGKGMYGLNIHLAVIDAKESVTGITIHWVNKNYDDGATIFQATCSVEPTDTAESLAKRVGQLEYDHFPRVIGEILKSTYH